MSMMTATLVTAENLARNSGALGGCELVDGEVVPMSPAGFQHGAIAMYLGASLCFHADERRLGKVVAAETGFVLKRNPDTVRAPDIAFVSQSRLGAADLTSSYFEGAPDIAVEVISPSDSFSDVEAKALSWLDAGCQIVWIVDPRQRHVTEYRSAARIRVFRRQDTLAADDLLPGWSLQLATLFA